MSVDDIPGSFRWGFAPHIIEGPYAGSGIHNG